MSLVVELAKPYPFTSLFTYDPARHEIGEHDRAMLDLLIQMNHNDEAYREYYSDLAGYLPVTDRKDMFVNPRQWADMLRLLPDVDVKLEGGRRELGWNLGRATFLFSSIFPRRRGRTIS